MTLVYVKYDEPSIVPRDGHLLYTPDDMISWDIFHTPSEYLLNGGGFMRGVEGPMSSRSIIGRERNDWCASKWAKTPTDTLWRDQRDVLLTHVMHESLNFQNTPFEHRYNLIASYTYAAEQKLLASKEYRTWSRGFEAFIPFKKPHPEGYQGVWGNFDDWIMWDQAEMRVHDKYDSGVHLLKVGW